MLAKNAGVRTDKKLFNKLENNKGYLAPDLHNLFDDWFNHKLKTSVYMILISKYSESMD